MQTEHYVAPTPFLEREETWVKEKHEKIMRKQEVKKNSELDGCSFKPKLLNASSQAVFSRYKPIDNKNGGTKGSYLEKYRKKV